MTPAALEWVARFRRYMTSERRLSAHTDRSYSRDLTALVRFCDRSGVADWDRLDTQHVRLFAAQSHASGLAPRSIQRRLSAVRSFYEFLLREGRDGATRGAAPASARRGTGARIRVNPAHDVRAPKAARRLPQTLDPDQMARLLELPPGDALTARDRAIMELLYSSGLRLARSRTVRASPGGISRRRPRPRDHGAPVFLGAAARRARGIQELHDR